MKTEKDFDYLKFKRQAQARFAEKYTGLSPEQTVRQLDGMGEAVH